MHKLLSLALCVLLAVSGTVHAAADATGKPAPDFTLKSTSGKNVRLAEQRGDVVMINFWATWCGPCRQEMPLLEKLHGKYKDLGFTLLGINVEADDSGMAKYLKDVPVSFPILRDGENRIARLYGVDGMPSTVIVDRGGKVRFVHRGYKPGYEQKYEQQIKQLVME
ncbi:MAG: TlpA family protein disulfide reductase [Pseudomonadota bacterium]